MYDLDMTRDSGTAAFRNLFRQADHYDGFLKSEYSCTERLEE
jgi:serine protease Do